MIWLRMLWQLGLRTSGRPRGTCPWETSSAGSARKGSGCTHLASGRDPRLSQPAAAHPDLSVETEIDPPADRLGHGGLCCEALWQISSTPGWPGRVRHWCAWRSVPKPSTVRPAAGRWRHGFRFSPPDLVDRVRWQLDGWRSAKGKNSPTGGISFIRLRAVETLPDEGRQLGFWGGQSEVDERAERALQRVQTLVGFDGVTVGRLGSGRRFADLEQRLPFGTAGPRGIGASSTAGPRGIGASSTAGPRGIGASDTPPWPGRLGAPAPAEMLAEPEPLVVLDANGDPVGVSGRAQASAPPAMLRRADGRTSRIAAWAGPWPLDERWWSTQSRRQARFQLVLDDGTAHLCAVEVRSLGSAKPTLRLKLAHGAATYPPNGPTPQLPLVDQCQGLSLSAGCTGRRSQHSAASHLKAVEFAAGDRPAVVPEVDGQAALVHGAPRPGCGRPGTGREGLCQIAHSLVPQCARRSAICEAALR